MKVENTYKNIWQIAYPIILGSLATTVLNLTDTAFIARVGEVELGAMAITTVFYLVMVMVGISMGIGAQILMARRAGEGNHDEIGRLFDHTLLLLLSFAAISFLFTYFLSPWFFEKILRSELIIGAATEYMIPRSYGLLVSMAAISFRAFYIGISQTRIITYTSIIMLLVNVILDYVLIFGHYGFPAMGLRGAAIASVIAEVIAFIYLVVYSGLKHEFNHYRLFRFSDMKASRFYAILNLSSPVIMQNSLSMGSWFIFFVFIEHMGERPLAISNIVRSTYMVLMTPLWGFASATSSMVSNLIGQERAQEVKRMTGKIIILSFLTTLGVFCLSFLSPFWLLRLVTPDESLISDAIGTYYIVLGAMFIFSVGVMLLSTVSGTGNTRAAMVIELFNISIYLLYIYLCVFRYQSSIEVVWFSEIIYWVMMGTVSYLYLEFNRWKPKNI